MRYYAKVFNGIVQTTIVADPSFFDTFIDTSPGSWIETTQDGSLRANYANTGFIYDSVHDVFYAPQPSPNFKLNQTTWTWEE